MPAGLAGDVNAVVGDWGAGAGGHGGPPGGCEHSITICAVRARVLLGSVNTCAREGGATDTASRSEGGIVAAANARVGSMFAK